MRPNNAGISDDANNDELKQANEEKPQTDGELTIDHSDSEGQKADSEEKIAVKTEYKEEYATPQPAQVFEPTVVDSQEPDSTGTEPSIVVPGGVSAQTPDPQTFFKSKYDNPHQAPPHQPYSPLNPSQTIVGNAGLPANSGGNGYLKSSNKRIMMIGAGVAVFLLVILGYIFGIYIPNKPENVYSTGLDRTGTALEKVVNKITSKEQLAKLESGEVNGTFELKTGDETINGTLAAKYNADKLVANIDATSKLAGQDDQTYGVSVVSEKPDGADFPNIFFKATGVNLLGLDQIIPGIDNYNDKWVEIDGDYAKSLEESFAGLIGGGLSSSASTNVSSASVAQLAKSLSGVANDYIFTSSPDKSVFVQKEFVGKETVGDTKTYHYKVSLNKENVGTLCKAFNQALIDSDISKSTGDNPEAVESEKADANAICDEAKGNIGDDETLDLWIDAKYKLIYKVRFTDQINPETYVEIGQSYKRGDVATLFVNYKDADLKIDAQAVVSTNMKTGASNFKLAVNSNSDEEADKVSLTLSLDSKPLNGDIAIDKPKDAVKLKDAANQLGIDIDSLITPQSTLLPTNQEY